MLLTIIFVFLIILGIVLIKKDYLEIGACMFTAGLVSLFICVILIIIVQIPKQADYEKEVMRRDMLVYRLENIENEQAGNELLYSDILNFNQDLYSVKRWYKNPWVNWFWNDKIAELDYIDCAANRIVSE